jgi:hypothetical protein
MHCRACNKKGHLKGSDKCEKAASKTKEVKANQVQLSDADLKTIAEYIKVSVKTADVQVSPGEPAGSTSPFFPPRIQIPGLNR